MGVPCLELTNFDGEGSLIAGQRELADREQDNIWRVFSADAAALDRAMLSLWSHLAKTGLNRPKSVLIE